MGKRIEGEKADLIASLKTMAMRREREREREK
jgi:hypothetical protein